MSCTQIIAQQIEDLATLVGIADWDVARRLHPEIDVGIELVGPLGLDDDVAGAWMLSVSLALFGGFTTVIIRTDIRTNRRASTARSPARR